VVVIQRLARVEPGIVVCPCCLRYRSMDADSGTLEQVPRYAHTQIQRNAVDGRGPLVGVLAGLSLNYFLAG
jgi:hypothetical protein